MRHQRRKRKLSRTTKHRKALLRNLVRSLVISKRIRTTLPKAKEASSVADKMVQLAKKGDLHSRRLLISKTGCAKTTAMLIKQIAPKFKDREGGYTRVLRLGPRESDGAEMALLEFSTMIVEPKPKKEAKPKKGKAASTKAEPAPTKEKKTKKASAKKADTAKLAEEETADERDEAQKKGGFLGKLRKYLKGDE